MKKIVIKVGGSLLLTKENRINHNFVSQFCQIIRQGEKYDQIIIICGGGSLAREYITFLRSKGINEAFCDSIGINISHLNSKMMIACLKDIVYPKVPKNLEDLSLALQFGKLIIMGGIQPGQSTTSVAMEVAEFIDAPKVIILTDVEGIYDKDPAKDKDAKLIKSLTYDELNNLLMKASSSTQSAAGEYRIFDLVSLQILRRSQLEVFITSGQNLEEFRKLLLEDKKINGTLISI
jgi:uridylate kinase